MNTSFLRRDKPLGAMMKTWKANRARSHRALRPQWKSFSRWFLCAIVIGVGSLAYCQTATMKGILRAASGKEPVPNEEPDSDRQVRVLFTQILVLRGESSAVEEAFSKTFISQHLLQPTSFSDAATAAQSKADLERYCSATHDISARVEPLLAKAAEISGRAGKKDLATAEYAAFDAWCSAIVGLYSYASEPYRNVHVVDNSVRIRGADEYNRHIEAVNAAGEKLGVAQQAFAQAQEQLAKELKEKYGITSADYEK